MWDVQGEIHLHVEILTRFLWAEAAGMAMTLTSIILPRWISWNSEILNEKVMYPPPLTLTLATQTHPN